MSRFVPLAAKGMTAKDIAAFTGLAEEEVRKWMEYCSALFLLEFFQKRRRAGHHKK
ncbi:hypothetical protein [Geobacillus sp. E263]|uniref:hypothetical protein n=1 Tax=Geobacillus sp. E263 TaxID=391290 RepID=UPI00155E9809|nr:hypothetical protein [Geobacillus sp. E263]